MPIYTTPYLLMLDDGTVISLPTSDGTAGQSLVTDADGTASFATRLANVVEDTTPQLGGNLDVNGFNVGGVTPTELGYVSGVTSDIQTQIDGKAASSHTHTASQITDFDTEVSNNTTVASALQNVVEDTTPQLGGNLDTNGQKITAPADKFQMEGSQSANAVGTDSLDLQVERTAATQVASGTRSFTAGTRNTASGTDSVAAGHNNTTTGARSSAIGYQNTLSNETNAFGQFNNGSGAGSFTTLIGYSNTASNYYGNALLAGLGNSASGYFGITTVGINNTGSGYYISTFGYSCTNNAQYSTVVGYQAYAGTQQNASAFGYQVRVEGNDASVFGRRAKTTVDQTVEAGYWSNSSTRAASVRMHPNGQVAMTIEDSATAPTDGGATAGSEADATLPRGMYTIQKDGSKFRLYENAAGTITEVLLNPMTPVSIRPQQLVADSTNGFGITTRNQHVLAAFDDTTDEIGYYTGVLPDDYQGDGVTVEISWIAATATSGNVRWLVAWERLNDGGTDLDSDSFASDNIATGAARATNGQIRETSISFTDGGDMDSTAAGDVFRLRITRDADDAADTMTGDAQIVNVKIRGANEA